MSLSARRAWIEIVKLDGKPLPDQSLSARRAWIEITVSTTIITICIASLSARRAWIEIASGRRVSGGALSLSARRAWIEISRAANCQHRSHVALRKESVDRNSTYVIRLPRCQGRSPQGERG